MSLTPEQEAARLRDGRFGSVPGRAPGITLGEWDNVAIGGFALCLKERETYRSLEAAKWLREEETSDEVWRPVNNLLDFFREEAAAEPEVADPTEEWSNGIAKALSTVLQPDEVRTANWLKEHQNRPDVTDRLDTLLDGYERAAANAWESPVARELSRALAERGATSAAAWLEENENSDEAWSHIGGLLDTFEELSGDALWDNDDSDEDDDSPYDEEWESAVYRELAGALEDRGSVATAWWLHANHDDGDLWVHVGQVLDRIETAAGGTA